MKLPGFHFLAHEISCQSVALIQSQNIRQSPRHRNLKTVAPVGSSLEEDTVNVASVLDNAGAVYRRNNAAYFFQ